uniref:Peptidase S1 domain-containing protein n=1 Tax=Trichuris muris TaxID=70415 RepID=A0A5S6QL24_TRIMR
MKSTLILLAVAYFVHVKAETLVCGIPEDNGLLKALETPDDRDRLPTSSTPWVVAVYATEVHFGAPQVRLCSGYIVNGRLDIVLTSDDCVKSHGKVKLAVEIEGRESGPRRRIQVKEALKLGKAEEDVLGNVLILKLSEQLPSVMAMYSICLPTEEMKFPPQKCLLTRWIIKKGVPDAVFGKDANGITEKYCSSFDKRYSSTTAICLKSTDAELKNSLNSGETIVCHHGNIWYLYGVGLQQRYPTHKLFAKAHRVLPTYEKVSRPRFRL